MIVLHAAALSDLVSGQFAGPRLNAVLLSLFGAGAALLAAVGLYSLLAAAVKARRRELAIRQAIGATPARLRRMVVVQGAWLSGTGLASGWPADSPSAGCSARCCTASPRTTSTLW